MKAETRYMYMNEATKAETRYINMQCEMIAETRYESRKRRPATSTCEVKR